MKKILDRILAVFLICLLTLPVITMNHQPGKISETENRYLADFPQIFDADGNLLPNLKSSLNTWFSDNLGFRDEFIKLSSYLQYHILNQSPSTKVEIGKDGWFFYTMDNNLDIASGNYPNFDEVMLRKICRQQIKIQEKLKSQGIEYVLVLPASKVSVYPEYIRSGDFSVTRTPHDILADYLEEHSEIKVVRLKDALLEAKDSGQLYFKTDTHWNEYGAYVACSKIIKELKQWGIVKQGMAGVSFTQGTYLGEFSAMMGNVNLLGLEPCPKSVIMNPTAQKIESEKMYDMVRNLAWTANVHNPIYLYRNKEIMGPRILMYGDSLFGMWNATELLAESSSEFTYIWDFEIRQDMIDLVKPNVVLYEMGERYLNWLSTKSRDFTKTILNNPSAKIVSHDAPAYVNHSDTYTIHITVENTGTENWCEDDEIRLCIWQDGIDWGYRLLIPEGVVVEPGEQYVFTLEGFVLPEGEQTVLEFQMLQEGIQWFGERERVDITAKVSFFS